VYGFDPGIISVECAVPMNRPSIKSRGSSGILMGDRVRVQYLLVF
jgi:hypothetical protein